MVTTLKINLSEEANGGAGTEKSVLDTIDFSDWYFYPEQNDGFAKALGKLVREEMAEAFRNTLLCDPPAVAFVSDGINVEVTMNCGSNWNDGRIFFIASIAEMIDDYIYITDPQTMAGGDEARRTLSECLRDCVQRLEKARDRDGPDDRA